MVGKSHCFYEFDDEYEDFYQPNTSTAPSVGYVDETGELHFDGKVYGHGMQQWSYKQKLSDPEEIGTERRQAITRPVAPRESIPLERDAIARKRQCYRQKYISKREKRLVSKEHHPFAEIHSGNTETMASQIP
jgi:hypothetical protein